MIPSPDSVERGYARVEERLLARLAGAGNAVTALAALLTSAAFLWISLRLESPSANVRFHLADLVFLRLALPAIPLFAGMVFLAGGGFRANAIVTCLLWVLAASPVTDNAPLPMAIAILVSLPAVLALVSWQVARAGGSPSLASRTLVGAFLAVSLALVGWRIAGNGALKHAPLFLWFRFKMMFLFLFGLVLVTGKNGPADWRLLWNPAHCLHGVLWPRSVRFVGPADPERRRLWWLGMLDLWLGGALLLCELGGMSALYGARSSSILATYVSEAFLFRVGDMAAFHLYTGVARMYGYAVPDMVSFLFLARDTADIWQRINTYNYRFVGEFVFFPLARMLRSPVVASFVAFTAFYGFFFVPYFLLAPTQAGLIHRAWGNPWRSFVYSTTAFLLFYALLLFARLAWPLPRRAGESPWRAWASVLLALVLQLCAIAIAGELSIRLCG